jgi:signal transduction histidine kinase
MDLVSHSVLFLAAACLVLGAINLRLWLASRDRWDLLAMSTACLFSATYALFEVYWIHVESPQEYGEILRWSQIGSSGVIISLAIFLRLNLNPSQKWLFWALVVTRLSAASINFVMPVNLQFREITAIGQVSWLGEKLSYPIGVPNPWHITAVLSFIFLFAYGLDALLSGRRRGENRSALVFGGGIALMAFSSLAIGGAIIWFGAGIPALVSPSLLFILIAMAAQFGYDLRRSAQLADKLTHREIELTETLNQLDLSTSAAEVGIWELEAETGRLLASDKMRELFQFTESTPLTLSSYLARVHPDDRKRIEHTQNNAIETDQPYEAEYRVQLFNGDIRWMRSLGQVHTFDGGRKLLRVASVDITRRKIAEDDAHELSGKLIHAQEKERARLARELHDDLSQSLAILSIQLQSLVTKSSDAKAVKEQVDKLTGEIQQLSSDVHRISHELHPAKLNQLGLEAALRGFCREAGAANGLKVSFKAKNVPGSLPNDHSLCLYRIAQEALQNAVKHSGASIANVELGCDDNVVKLVVSDNGSGFDTDAVRAKESLGLISMHERIRAVYGTLSIDSVPDSGTKIEARVPLPREQALPIPLNG